MKFASATAVMALGLIAPMSGRTEMVMNLHSAKVVIGTETVKGYLVLPYKEDLDIGKPEGLAFVRGMDFDPSLFESIQETAAFGPDMGHFRFTTRKPVQISRKKIVSITPLKWDLDEMEPGAIATVTEKDAALLKTPPLAWCKGKIWDGDFWLSYNPKVTKEQLDKLCDRDFEHRPSDAEQKALLDNGKVVHFTYPTGG